MLRSRRLPSPPAAALAAAAALALLGAPPASAGPTVSVRVEGLNETLIAPTTVTTTTAPVVNDGDPADSCEGTSALGALQLASGGNWTGTWELGQYFIDSIAGESHLYHAGERSYYWAFWVDDKYSEAGACDVQLENGERLLFVPECDEDCPSGPSPTPLEIEAPAVAELGESVPVTVRQYDQAGEPSPAAGASITWPGGSASTDPQGEALLTFARTGVVAVHVTGAASGPPAVRTEASICIHRGDDGNCGTSAPASTPSVSGSAALPATGAAGFQSSHGPAVALAAQLEGVREGRVYGAGRAPRILSGRAAGDSPVTALSIELHRRYRNRCSQYSGTRERFVPARCGHGSFFKVSGDGTFSYLLPAPLGPGRYVLDIEATDAQGQRTTLARGTTRIVFYVR